MNDRNAPIGIFDSGVGGLTVFKALSRRLPNESLIYLGDTARIPYGTRSIETVQRYAAEDAAFIQSKNVKLIVIACNTASALAADQLEQDCPVPVIGVIKPGAERAAAASRNGKIGIIATEATVSSGAYELRIREHRPDLDVTAAACPLFVPLAEEGWIDHPATRQIAEEYLSGLRQRRVDTLVLGCTHYPILRPVIEQVMGDSVQYIDSGEAVSEDVASLLEDRDLQCDGSLGERFEEFYVTDSPARFRKVAERFLGRPVGSVSTISLGV